MRSLPKTVSAYKRTPDFTEATVPAGLTKDHSTKAGVWAVISVLSGRLRLEISSEDTDVDLAPDQPGVVAPEAAHRVTPLGPVRFYVTFYR
ncbi:MAG: DUF1971 domain-containing protein [Alphaproteobacteria bacterium]|nr:DUF1971 domain-containing protein [Alphaproteobacteria bacterium]